MWVALRKLPLGNYRYRSTNIHGLQLCGLGQDDGGDLEIDTSPEPIIQSLSPEPVSIEPVDIAPTPVAQTLTPGTTGATYTAVGGQTMVQLTDGSWVAAPSTLSPTEAAYAASPAGQAALKAGTLPSALQSIIGTPVPTTVPIGAPQGAGTSVASALNWFSQSSLIPGWSNGVVILGGIAAIAAIAAMGSISRR